MTTSAVLPGRDFCFPRKVFLGVIMQVADYRIVYGVDIKPREPGWITGGRGREGTGGGGGAVRGGGWRRGCCYRKLASGKITVHVSQKSESGR